jgi:hypothetical protein
VSNGSADVTPGAGGIDPAVRARARELHTWIDEFGIRYGLDDDPTEVGPLQAAEYANGTAAIYARYSEFHRDYEIVKVRAVLGARDAVVLLLRRLAGRLGDDAEAALWVALADDGPADAGPLLIEHIVGGEVRLTEAEGRLLKLVGADPAGFASEAEFTVDQDDVEVLYYFDPKTEARHELPIAMGGIDIAIGGFAATHPGIRLVGRAWRSPAQHHAPSSPTWVYVVVVDPEADAPTIRRALTAGTGTPFPYPVEVVEEGRDLPYYQVAARARAKRVWPEDPHLTGIATHHWLRSSGQDPTTQP